MANIKALYPGITPAEVNGWVAFFRRAEQLTAKLTIDQLVVHGPAASAEVSGVYAFVPRGGGVQREDRPHFTMRFTKLSIGWRLASVREARPPK